MTCPVSAEQHANIKTYWREDGTCSYCGSISSDLFFQCIETGCEVIPTDKNYKVYVKIANPKVGEPRIVASANFKPNDNYELVTTENISNYPIPIAYRNDYIGKWIQLDKEPELTQVKFYFEHLSEEDKQKFVALLNKKNIKLGYPGHFYVLPYFIQNVKAS